VKIMRVYWFMPVWKSWLFGMKRPKNTASFQSVHCTLIKNYLPIFFPTDNAFKRKSAIYKH
jgi:hypothetical protein